MWIFSSPKNYNEMVSKISSSVFFVSIFLLLILTNINKDFYIFLNKASFGLTCELFGLKLNIALLYIPTIMSLSEHMFKFHDKISIVLGIRNRYDRDIIIKEYFKRLDINNSLQELSAKDVREIMNIVFYKYASSTNPQIDVHNIVLALNGWCWYWIVLDSFVLVLISGMIFLISTWSLLNLFIVILILIILIIYLFSLKHQNIIYTIHEIDNIFEEKDRVSQIKKDLLNALHS